MKASATGAGPGRDRTRDHVHQPNVVKVRGSGPKSSNTSTVRRFGRDRTCRHPVPRPDERAIGEVDKGPHRRMKSRSPAADRRGRVADLLGRVDSPADPVPSARGTVRTRPTVIATAPSAARSAGASYHGSSDHLSGSHPVPPIGQARSRRLANVTAFYAPSNHSPARFWLGELRNRHGIDQCRLRLPAQGRPTPPIMAFTDHRLSHQGGNGCAPPPPSDRQAHAAPVEIRRRRN